jgi:hypothetical protein
VAALDTISGRRLDYRAEERFPMCSTFKFLRLSLNRCNRKRSQATFRIYCLNFVDAQFAEGRSVCIMKTLAPKAFASSAFRIVPLPTEIAERARRLAKTDAPDHATVVADSPTGYPCRHCLRWAKPGERVILFPYASIPPGHPYFETGPIFVHAEPCERYCASAEYPADFRNGRALRAYDADYNMIDAEVANGNEPEAIIEKLFQNPKTEFVDARSVSRGCFTFRILRA